MPFWGILDSWIRIAHQRISSPRDTPSGDVSAGVQDGMEAILRGDYLAAVKTFRSLAENGVPDAQNSLGMMHKLGMGVPKDNREAAKWFHKAAAQGFVDAEQ